MVAASTSACLTRQLPLDQSAGLQIVARTDAKADTREWQTQTRYVEGGPLMPLGVPAFSVDVVAFENGPKHTAAAGTSGFLLRIHSKDWGWRFLREREIDLWLDGVPIQLGEGDYVDSGLFSDPQGYRFNNERLVVPVLRDELDRVVRALNVEVSVGTRRFRLHPASKEVIERLLLAVPPSVKD